MRFFFFVTCILLQLVPLCLVAQSVPVSDYLVLVNGDTVYGELQWGVDKDLANGPRFKQAGQAQFTRYGITEVSAFGFANGRTFVNMNQLAIKGSEDQPKVFIKQLVWGDVNLYVWNYSGKAKSDYFLLKDSSLLHLTPPVKEVVERNGEKYSAENKEYLQALATFLSGHSQFSVNQKLRYTDKKIASTVVAFNKVSEAERPVSVYKAKNDISFSMNVGVPVITTISDAFFIRAAGYANFFNEKSTTTFIRSGLILQYNVLNNVALKKSHGNGQYITTKGLLNLVPIAAGVQARERMLQPYGYAGLGLMFFLEEQYVVTDTEVTDSSIKPRFTPIPTLNVGVGTKINLKKTTLNLECTPTISGAYISAGLTF